MTKNAGLVLAGIILFTLISSQARAQQNGEIKGTVVESTTNEPLDAATVRLLSSNGSTMHAAVASENDGAFLFTDIPAGDYLLMVTYIGFEPVYQPVQVTSDKESVDIGCVEMEESVIVLDEVVVTAEYAEVKLSDKFNTALNKLLETVRLELPVRKTQDVAELGDEKAPVIVAERKSQ